MAETPRIQAADKIATQLESAATDDELRVLTTQFVTVVTAILGKPQLPVEGNSVAVTITLPKTAALLFDRVCTSPFAGPVPDDIRVYGATDPEIWLTAFALLKRELTPATFVRVVRAASALPELALLVREGSAVRDVSEALSLKHRVPLQHFIRRQLQKTPNIKPVDLKLLLRLWTQLT
jgi:hypothetical protein